MLYLPTNPSQASQASQNEESEKCPNCGEMIDPFNKNTHPACCQGQGKGQN